MDIMRQIPRYREELYIKESSDIQIAGIKVSIMLKYTHDYTELVVIVTFSTGLSRDNNIRI